MPAHPDPEEELLYERIADEIRRGEIRQGLWLKATVDAEGDDARARALYAKYRVSQFKREIQWFREAATAEVRANREVFVRALAQKGYAIAENRGAWILHFPDGNTNRFASFEECCDYCHTIIGGSVTSRGDR